jgi:hypothetical protein
MTFNKIEWKQPEYSIQVGKPARTLLEFWSCGLGWGDGKKTLNKEAKHLVLNMLGMEVFVTIGVIKCWVCSTRTHYIH